MIPAIFFPDDLKLHLLAQNLLVAEPQPLQPLTDEQAMRLAIQEAYRGLGFVSPNPLVGCVILDSKNRYLSKGYHARYGEAHAEINALRGLNHEQLQGAKVFVTLEPCAHQGKTPSCAKALALLPLNEVIFGLTDPNPLVSGQGIDILKSAGIQTRNFPGLESELESVCEHFLYNIREHRVFVTAKVASSLDGQLALSSGESKWISDEASRKVSHILRAAHDALLVGANTVLTDDPALNIRVPGFEGKKSKIIILDSDALCLAKLADLQISKVHSPQDLCFAISDRISNPPNPLGTSIIALPAQGLGLDLNVLLGRLWDWGLRSLFIEGGAHALSSFIGQKLAQRLYLFQAPLILGAKGGKAWTEQVKINSMDQRILLKNQKYISLQQDFLVTGKLN